MKRALLILLALLVFPFAVSAQGIPDVAQPDAVSALRDFYAARDFRTVWTNGERFTARGRDLPAVLEGAGTHGLNPEAYGLTRMRTVLETEQPDGPNAWRQAELFWSYAVWLYAGDLLGRPADALTMERIVDGNVAENLAALAPDTPLYRALRERLAQLDGRNGAAPIEKPVNFSFGRSYFKPGMSHPMVPLLRARMASFGAYDVLPSETADVATVYDPNLAKAVGRFQHEYGLKSDGTIGPETLRLLNRDPAQERLHVIANLQRLREPHRRVREDRRIEVSIARYWLSAFDGGHEKFGMPVVVGKPGRQTISFRTEITGIRLNPDWNVPSTIKREDFIPLLVQDPAKLVRKYGVKVVKGGQSVDPRAVDWSQVPAAELSQLRFWHPAGDGNPLGRYRVIMENPYDIYLHDTNHPELFEASYRAQSSGCVRVARPDELARFILEGKEGWDSNKIKEIIKTNRTTDVVIENKIPIYLDYMTAWFNDRGQIILGVDVYALDKPRYDALVKRGLTNQRNAQNILNRVTDIFQPELKEAHHRDPVLTQSAN